MLSSLNSFTLSVRLMQTNSNQALVWIFSRVSQKMEIPLFKGIHIENIIPMTLCFPGIVFLDIQKSPKKILVYWFHWNVLCLLNIKRMQFVDNTRAWLKNRQVSNYQPLAFELNAFCIGTPVAFPQHVLLGVTKEKHKLHKDN